MSGLDPMSSATAGALPPRAASSSAEFAKLLGAGASAGSHAEPSVGAAGDARDARRQLRREAASGSAGGEDAPKLETILVSMLLKEAKLVSEGDALAPLAGQALVDHLVRSGAFDLGLRVEP